MSDLERIVSAADRIESAAHRMAILFEDGYGGNGVRLLEVMETDVVALRAKLQAAEAIIKGIIKEMPGAQFGMFHSRLRDGSGKCVEPCGGCRAEAAEAEVARLASEVREWLCDSCNTIYPGPPQSGVWCVVCPKCGGNTAPTKTIELRKARARVAELEAENNDLIVKVQFAESVIRDEKQIERTATEAALRWAWRNHPQLEYPTSDDLEDFVSTGLAALLGEK